MRDKKTELPWVYDPVDIPLEGTTLEKGDLKQFSDYLNLELISAVYSTEGQREKLSNTGWFSPYSIMNKNMKIISKPIWRTAKGVCHSHLIDCHMLKGFINIFQRNLRPDINAQYLNWVFSQNSPWAGGFENTYVIRDKDHDDFPMAVVMTNVDKPDMDININAIIAARNIPHYGTDIIWKRFVDAGLSERAAYIMVNWVNWPHTWAADADTDKAKGVFGLDPENHQKLAIKKPKYADVAMYPTEPCMNSDYPFNSSLFMKATPVTKKRNFKTTTTYTNHIWTNSAGKVLKVAGVDMTKWIDDTAPVPKAKDPFGLVDVGMLRKKSFTKKEIQTIESGLHDNVGLEF